MKINKILLLCSMLSLLLFSCIKDKGNYTYGTLKQIYVNFEFSIYNVVAGESVDILPVLKYNLYAPELIEKELIYEWSIDNKVVSTENVFKYQAGSDIIDEMVILKVTEPDTKEVYVGSVRVKVESAYKQGVVILHENEDGEAEISFIRSIILEKDINGETFEELSYNSEYKNIYKENNGVSLGKEPVSITEHSSYNGGYNSYDHTELTVVTEGGNRMIDVHGFSMKKETSVEEEFSSGTPENFSPKQVVHTNFDSYLIAQDGYMYSRRNADDGAYHTGTYNKDMKYFGAKYSDVMFAPYWRSSALLAIEFDKENPTVRNYIGILADDYNDSYNSMRLPAIADDPELLKNVHDVKGEVICYDYDYLDLSDNVSQRILMKIDGKYYMHLLGMDYIRRKNMKVYENTMVDLGQFNGGKEVLGLVTNKVSPLAYYWDDSKIYAYDWTTKTNNEIFATQDKKIVSVAVYSKIKNFDFDKGKTVAPSLIVAFDNGEIEIFEINHFDHKKIEKSIYRSTNKFGKIKQVIYKLGEVEKFVI